MRNGRHDFLTQTNSRTTALSRPLHMVFVHTKAFNPVHREKLWKMLQKIGWPDPFTDLIASLHKDMTASVSLQGEFPKPSDVLNGVKRGCVLAPTLFSLFLSNLNCIFADCNKGVMTHARPGVNLFNVNQFVL